MNHEAFDYIRSITDYRPQIGLVLGSGLGDFAGRLKTECVIDYSDIPGFPVSTVSGHAGRFIFGELGGRRLVCMQGRVHYYEGYKASEAVLPIRLMKLLGADTVILTNAAGGINTSFNPGDLMIIDDHISSFVPSPLIGPNEEELGTRFPDMSCVYDRELIELARECADDVDTALKEGVYIQLSGPNYETPAEIRMCRMLGADAVGMSTAIEAMAAHHAGMRVFGMSLITNMAAGILNIPLSHEEVKIAADAASERFGRFLERFIVRIDG